MDDTYAHNSTGPRGNLYVKDKAIFNDTVSQRQQDANKIRSMFKAPDNRMDFPLE